MSLEGALLGKLFENPMMDGVNNKELVDRLIPAIDFWCLRRPTWEDTEAGR